MEAAFMEHPPATTMGLGTLMFLIVVLELPVLPELFSYLKDMLHQLLLEQQLALFQLSSSPL